MAQFTYKDIEEFLLDDDFSNGQDTVLLIMDLILNPINFSIPVAKKR